ncbi:MAG: hypothetical protein EBS39_10010 [Gammaproteobacteria bacterium]|nr:hypothetical protein [Gammaproteobacteria bacterium]
MNRILIVAEHDGARVNPAIAKCVTCARAIPDAQVTLAVFAAAGLDHAFGTSPAFDEPFFLHSGVTNLTAGAPKQATAILAIGLVPAASNAMISAILLAESSGILAETERTAFWSTK